jgi:predicted NUDIX family phosphoesterase
MKQLVLCFPSDLLETLGPFQGISTDVPRYFPTIVEPGHCGYVSREKAEVDPSYKQVIPYVLFVHEDRIFSYRRGKSGSESRLREKLSIGIGGHIEVTDPTLFTTSVAAYRDALWREVDEEVGGVDHSSPEACAGLINDDSNDVGRVHFGVVHVIWLTDSMIVKKESTITASGLIPLEEALRDIDRYETWSQLCLQHIGLLLGTSAAADSLPKATKD